MLFNDKITPTYLKSSLTVLNTTLLKKIICDSNLKNKIFLHSKLFILNLYSI